MVKQTKRIEKNFSLNVHGYKINVILTSHLFIPRKQDHFKRIRAFMFKSRFQIEALLRSAVEDGILDYAHEKHVVYIFESLKTKYGALFDVVEKNDSEFEITIITVDQLKDQNYIGNDLFYREKNKIYSNFVLPYSYNKQITDERITVISTHNSPKQYNATKSQDNFLRVYLPTAC